jgi:hypothetical protein
MFTSSVGFGSSWIVLVIFLNDSRGSILFTFFCIRHLPKWYMMSVHV